MAQVILSAKDRQSVDAHAAASYPEECCGLLIGPPPAEDKWHISRVLPSANVSMGNPANTFEIDRTLLIRTQKELRGTGEEIIGYYHSHPNGTAEPSAVDEAGALDPRKVWIIAALRGQNQIPRLRAFLTKQNGTSMTFRATSLIMES